MVTGTQDCCCFFAHTRRVLRYVFYHVDSNMLVMSYLTDGLLFLSEKMQTHLTFLSQRNPMWVPFKKQV